MHRLFWWLADRIARRLQQPERDAVLGDLSELNASGWQALRETSGLVLRRDLAYLKDWRIASALVLLAGPFALLLSPLSSGPGLFLIKQASTYRKYGVWMQSGLTPGEEVAMLAAATLAVILWSWTAGFVLGSLSKQAVWLTASVFFGVATFAMLPRLPAPAAAVLFGTTVKAAIFLVPSALGVRSGVRHHWRITRGVAASTIVLAALNACFPVLIKAAHERWSEGAWAASVNWPQIALVLMILTWPAAYILHRRQPS